MKMSDEKNNKVYVTGNPDNRERISRLAGILVKCGYEDSHQWCDGSDRQKYIDDELTHMETANLVIVDMDMFDIVRCWGWACCALGMGKEVWIVGVSLEPEPFFFSSRVIRFNSWDEVFSELHPI